MKQATIGSKCKVMNFKVGQLVRLYSISSEDPVYITDETLEDKFEVESDTLALVVGNTSSKMSFSVWPVLTIKGAGFCHYSYMKSTETRT